MQPKTDLSRITIDLPKESHRKLKTLAALLGKSMREVVVETIEQHLFSDKIPNKKTLKAIKDAEKRKNLVRTQSAQDLFKKLGI